MKQQLLILALAGLVRGDECILEPGFSYDSLWNETALRLCPGVARPERVCIVGGGSSGVHLGWLLKRRGFDPVLFERKNRLGGDIWTRHRVPNSDPNAMDDDDITRELGAAFLSPDYDEVRALLARYDMPEQPISAVTEMQFHAHYPSEVASPVGAAWAPSGGGGGGGGEPTTAAPPLPGAFAQHAVAPSDWAAHWTAAITGDPDPAANDAAVAAALAAYVALHIDIFGDMGRNRFPPEPATDEQLAMLQGSGLAFLVRNGLGVLQPLFYQFFVLQVRAHRFEVFKEDARDPTVVGICERGSALCEGPRPRRSILLSAIPACFTSFLFLNRVTCSLYLGGK